MTPEIPEWLNRTFLQKALQRQEEKEPTLTIEDFSVKLAVAAGNNYTSQIFRVNVKYKSEDLHNSPSIIVKSPYPHFQKIEQETIMYKQILPKMKEKIKFDLGPTIYYSTQQNVLVLQDLTGSGYVMCNKFTQLDYPHCELVFRRLAKFHAASVALHSENPEIVEDLGKEVLYTEGSTFVAMMKPLLTHSIAVVTEALEATANSKEVIEFLLDNKQNFFESLIEVCQPKAKGLNVLNHGDLWNNNMMFKHKSSGEVEDVKFVDFQALRYMSPAIDILYFSWTSADEEVRENRLQELYDVYLQELNECLQQLGCEERYTSEELWQDMKSSVKFVLAITLLNLPLMMVEPLEAFDMSKFDEGEFIKWANNGNINPKVLRVYNGKHFKTKIPTIIRQIHSRLL
ncbi:uncharacterized protein LOC129002261 [Macrosteles quadrilineatus]|uniref:uncharacterized protein LOC129002261 n=1 Tax=Macrosteles quadrilineatus TaxID=74068 RepID=UPI0023E16601|nr:uncharacterized protein LOC129002261 [Macrosteles quadrilineatus]